MAHQDSHPLASSSEVKIVNFQSHLQTLEGDSLSQWLADHKNPLADFEFDKLPTELLVDIFRHARANTARGSYNERYPYPVAVSHVCRNWRTVALSAPTLWTNVLILGRYREETRDTARAYLERSRTCPVFLTWLTKSGRFCRGEVRGVIEDLIIPAAKRWQRITLNAGKEAIPDPLLTTMGYLDFPILQDVEISWTPFLGPFSPKNTCRSAPLLRRCRLRDIPSLPPLPSNLVVLDYVFPALESPEFDLDPLLEFLPHVAHSLEHLRFGPSSVSEVRSTPRTPRVALGNLKSLHIKNSHVIVDHILTPNLTCFVVSNPLEDGREAAGMFDRFSAPKLQSIQFHGTPLSPILATSHLPSMFPQLESISLLDCMDELPFVPLLEPEPTKLSSPEKAPQHPPKHQKVENPFPHLKVLTVSDMTVWDPLLDTIGKRRENGDESLRKIQLPKGGAAEAFMPRLRQCLSPLGVEPVLCERGELLRPAPEFQDEFCDEEDRLFSEISVEVDNRYWGDISIAGYETPYLSDDDYDDEIDRFFRYGFGEG